MSHIRISMVYIPGPQNRKLPVMFSMTRNVILFIMMLVFVMAQIRAFTSLTTTKGRQSRFVSMNLFKNLKKSLVSGLAGDYDEEVISKQLNQYANEKGIIMLSFENCPFCVRAREVLGEQRVQYKDIMIDKLDEGKALRSELGKQYGQTSVPAIWVNGVFVGGCNDGGIGGLIPSIKSGKFQELLKSK